jgi:hypothetical protein
MEPSPLLLRPILAYCTHPGWWMMMMSVEQSVECLAGEIVILGENLPSADLSTTNPTWPDLGLNLGHCGGMLATNCYSHGTPCH